MSQDMNSKQLDDTPCDELQVMDESNQVWVDGWKKQLKRGSKKKSKLPKKS